MYLTYKKKTTKLYNPDIKFNLISYTFDSYENILMNFQPFDKYLG